MSRKVVFYALDLDILHCTTKSLYNNVHKARYLGVTLCSGKFFGVNLRSAKSNFYSSFNSIFQSAAIYQDEIVVAPL